MLPYYAALAAGILCGVAGQIALKSGADGAATITAQFLHPSTMLGFAIYVLAAIFYIIAIKRIPVSLAYPSVSLSYVVVGLAAHFLWNEPFGIPQLIGIALIGGGILMLHQ
ncbi:MAG: EamA family transporter [Alphaproteobacteria bacterium]|nr:EamA family transporter [Alphaproteobacteria bacterium]